MESSELAIIGLTCCLVGVFLLANSIVFRRQRKVIEEFFGVGAGSLSVIRDYSLNKVQVVIGFLFLNTGFLLQGFAMLDEIRAHLATVLICLGIVVAAFGAYLIGLFYSRRSFRRYLREFFRDQPSWDFRDNMALTKEIGKFLNLRQQPDETVEEYVSKVRDALGLEARIASSPAPRVGDRGRKIRSDISALSGR